MMRLLFTIFLSFLLPTLAFFVYIIYKNYKKPYQPLVVPWGWLFITGIVLAGTTILAFGLTNHTTKEVRYQPSRLIDGKIIPGILTPKNESTEIK